MAKNAVVSRVGMQPFPPFLFQGQPIMLANPPAVAYLCVENMQMHKTFQWACGLDQSPLRSRLHLALQWLQAQFGSPPILDHFIMVSLVILANVFFASQMIRHWSINSVQAGSMSSACSGHGWSASTRFVLQSWLTPWVLGLSTMTPSLGSLRWPCLSCRTDPTLFETSTLLYFGVSVLTRQMPLFISSTNWSAIRYLIFEPMKILYFKG